MKVTRKMQFKTNEIYVGDQIAVKLKNFGKFTATAQKVTGKGVFFLFDEIIDLHPMNESNTNKGGFDDSDMKKWLNEVVLQAFPVKLRSKVTGLTLPTYGEIFGHDDDCYEKFEPDDDEQFEMTKRRGNRVCDAKDLCCWWWLRNKAKSSSASFALVNSYGYPYSYAASYSLGVRPEFWLIR